MNLLPELFNLLDNALKYNAPGGQVRVDLVCTDKNITVAVSDTGMGIPEIDQTRIFERFFRCDQSRSQHGCGMGLSFARAVARSHGGEITVTSEVGLVMGSPIGQVSTAPASSD